MAQLGSSADAGWAWLIQTFLSPVLAVTWLRAGWSRNWGDSALVSSSRQPKLFLVPVERFQEILWKRTRSLEAWACNWHRVTSIASIGQSQLQSQSNSKDGEKRLQILMGRDTRYISRDVQTGRGGELGYFLFFPKIFLSPNQTSQYWIRSLHVFFTFFISCRFSQQEAHLFF